MVKVCTSVFDITRSLLDNDPAFNENIVLNTLRDFIIIRIDFVHDSESNHGIAFTKFADSNYSSILSNFNRDAILKATQTLSPDKNLCLTIASCKMHTSRELSFTHLELRIYPTNLQTVPVVFVPLLVIDKSDQLITLWYCNIQYPSILINLMAHHLI